MRTVLLIWRYAHGATCTVLHARRYIPRISRTVLRARRYAHHVTSDTMYTVLCAWRYTHAIFTDGDGQTHALMHMQFSQTVMRNNKWQYTDGDAQTQAAMYIRQCTNTSGNA
ncbi:hypothetical protein AMTR_s00090p00077120 [Amborella trichopoda]|uniref:Uncharacterized protein n=1 Tax=Amborella trichopoda TaxID=13333 RepID=W1NVF9_AMBTC|nr:hypothetical protein AMTR_s00090p00077120 [Amborella trichopoda]